jgi:hypothetical protein
MTKILKDWNFLSWGRVRNTDTSDTLGSLIGMTIIMEGLKG